MKLELFGYTITISKDLLKSEEIPLELQKAIETIENYGMKAKSTSKQKEAAKKATEKRSEMARLKIENAINLLRLENKAINMKSVSVVSGCSINTVKKYKSIIEAQG